MLNKFNFKIVMLIFFFSLTVVIFAQSIDSYWSLVFAGENTTNPVFWNGNIYSAGKDKALNCITTDGKFLWRRNTEEYPSKFLSVSNSGLVYLITQNGNLEVFSSQGMSAWNYKLKKKPIFPVYTSKDGRAFVIQSNKILCLTPKGKLKWKIPIASEPIAPPVETGSKDIILILKSGDFVRISIFGSVVEQYQLKKNILAIGEAPEGYILAGADGNISYFKTSSGSTSVWQWNTQNSCSKIIYSNGNVLYLFKNGKAIYKTVKTNETLWEVQTKGNFSNKTHCWIASNEFNIVDTGYGCLITTAGKIKWERQIIETDFLPIITENGLLVGITKEFLNAYRVETKLTRRRKLLTQKPESYSILQNGRTATSKQEIPFFIEYATISEFFDVIKQDINSGNIGTKEPRYAFQLKSILENQIRASYIEKDFSSFDRAQAAELLGQLGSYEYREILTNAMYGDVDSTVLAGIVRGLAHLAYDPEGNTVEALKYAMGKAKYNDTELMKTIIDCFEVLIQYGNKKAAKTAILSLFSILTGPYSNIIQNYARQKIKNIV